MIIPYVMLFIAGIICLLKGSDYVTVYASKLAKHCGVSQLIIGITVVAMSTSLPELTVSIFSLLFETSQIATGTIIGSNIANVCLIVGISALLYPMKTNKNFLKQGYFTLVFTIAVVLFLMDGMVFYEGAILVVGFLIYMYYLINLKRKTSNKQKTKYVKKSEIKKEKKMMIKYIIFSLFGGLIVVVGAQTLIYSTIEIAKTLGISELLISLIAIAVGTSLPELAVSFTAAVKKLDGISIGNILGSNIFNIAILGLVSLFSTVSIINSAVMYNLLIMAVSVIVLLLFIKMRWKISRINGAVLLLIYAIFIYIQFI
ncbi:MAG: calcium/sodium antiporter [Candidatus Aenigmarchaeota archaeon]|nr:calcium/sodium antiporter [Candidatus Aenigmarchaeota archaeon]